MLALDCFGGKVLLLHSVWCYFGPLFSMTCKLIRTSVIAQWEMQSRTALTGNDHGNVEAVAAVGFAGLMKCVQSLVKVVIVVPIERHFLERHYFSLLGLRPTPI